jgi:Sulfite reductase, beta subunit (hemoprotein)
MYKLPETLTDDIQYVSKLIDEFKAGTVEPVKFKGTRVPMGIYEQRKDGTYMIRVRCTGGFITPLQLEHLAKTAIENNSPHLHITTRQEIQLHYIELERVKTILPELQQVELGTKGGGGNTIRNILVDINAGISDQEIFDIYPYAVDLTTRLISENDSFTMPRKLKIAFDISEETSDYAQINDLGLIPKIENGKRGFKVYLGGSVASNPTLGWKLFDFLPEEDLIRVAISAKRFFSAHGNRKNRHKARIRHIFYKLGKEETLRLFNDYFKEAEKDRSLDYKPSQLSFKTKVPSYLPEQNSEPSFLIWKKRYVVQQKQEGYSSVIVPILHGNASPDVFLKIAQAAGEFGNNTIRFTTRQTIQLRNIPNEYLSNLYRALQTIGIETKYPLLINNILSCTGADTCRLGICLSKGAVKALREKLIRNHTDLDILNEVKINISGCTNSCAQQVWADLGFSGRVSRNDNMYPSYTVYAKINGKDQLGQPLGVVSAHDLPAFTTEVLTAYAQKKSEHKAFTHYMQNEGKEDILTLIDKYANIPSFDEDKNYYYDWGSDSVFSVASRGKAECSAGLFDMIDIDNEFIDKGKKALTSDNTEQVTAGILYDILFSASRMLLITRGAEPHTTEEVFTDFIRLFIEAGLVDKRFTSIVELGKTKNEIALFTEEKEVLALADTVQTLYQNMDDSLQFKNVSTATEAIFQKEKSKGSENVVIKDFRGVGCPMNFVKTKIALTSLSSGNLLEVWLDDGAPIENVPGSVRNEGHTIVSTIQEQNYWKVLIRKA